MSHIAFQPRRESIDLTADYVVVGSGAGGSAAAVRLAREGAKVAIVEAGPWRDPEDYPSSVYGTLRDMYADWGSVFTLGRAFWPIIQGSLVGGTTVVNSAICVRTPGDIFERWKSEHGVGGDEMAQAVWRIQDILEKDLCAETTPDNALGRSNTLAMQGATALAFESNYTKRYVKACAGAGQCMQGCRANRKQSTNVNYIPEVIQRGGDVLSCAPVHQIIFRGDRAIGVTGYFRHPATRQRGGRFFVHATKGVLVAASVTQSPLILMRSGVRSKALGRYFHAHPGAPIFGCYDEPVDMNTGTTQGWASVAFRENRGFKLEVLSLPLDMFAGRLPGGGVELMERLTEYRHLAVWVQACRAESVGSIRRGLRGEPVVTYSLNENDMRRFREGMAFVAKTHFAAGARAVIPGIWGLPYKLGPDEVDKISEGSLDPRDYVAVLSHLFGGCVMGSDPSRSVCDGQGRVHGYTNLYIADASMIPTNLGVNPQHTIMGLAWLCAERLLD
jgi:choline dehydrogenase-like flavoprotein